MIYIMMKVSSVHGITGVIGSLAIGFFSAKDVNPDVTMPSNEQNLTCSGVKWAFLWRVEPSGCTSNRCDCCHCLEWSDDRCYRVDSRQIW